MCIGGACWVVPLSFGLTLELRERFTNLWEHCGGWISDMTLWSPLSEVQDTGGQAPKLPFRAHTLPPMQLKIMLAAVELATGSCLTAAPSTLLLVLFPGSQGT